MTTWKFNFSSLSLLSVSVVRLGPVSCLVKVISSPPWPVAVSRLVRADLLPADPQLSGRGPQLLHYLPAQPERISAAQPAPPAGDPHSHTLLPPAAPVLPDKLQEILKEETIDPVHKSYIDNYCTCSHARCHVLSGQHPRHTRRHPRHQFVPLSRVHTHLA